MIQQIPYTFLLILLLTSEGVYSLTRDPTEPPLRDIKPKEIVVKQERVPELTAIMISGNRRTAIIDDRLVKVGDSLGNKKVKYIGQYSVKLIGDGKETVLHIFGSAIKE
jgi:hypothetical protein